MGRAVLAVHGYTPCLFSAKPQLVMLVRTFDKMPAEKKALHHLNAGRYLQQLEPKVSIKR